jgi:hypothetical protein
MVSVVRLACAHHRTRKPCPQVRMLKRRRLLAVTSMASTSELEGFGDWGKASLQIARKDFM